MMPIERHVYLLEKKIKLLERRQEGDYFLERIKWFCLGVTSTCILIWLTYTLS